MNIQFDLKDTSGVIKPMHAVNNGPAFPNVRGMSNFETYKEAGIPYARNHDASFYASYGGEHIVDVHRIFKNFDADENDPASYVFEPTDKYLENTIAAGTKVFYRLGASIEHEYKYGTRVPKDFHKWARICEHIIRHYTEGWANGFHYDIEYWEIWNEPECKNFDGSHPCWQGTEEQFIELYSIAAKHLKACFPHLKIGGPAFCGPHYTKFRRAFLQNAKEKNVPLDFYSYHMYAREPKFLMDYVQAGEEELKICGLEGTETILNEWNYVKAWLGEEYVYTMKQINGLKGASFVTGGMITGQASSLSMLMYYDARPGLWCGLYDQYLQPQKAYYSIKAYSTLYQLGTEVKASGYLNDDIYSLTATDGKESAILLTRYRDVDEAEPERVTLNLTNLEENAKVEYYLLDTDHNLELVREEMFAANEVTLHLNVKMFDTYLIKIVLA
ncbi:MAG: hypothetical protein IJE10_01750 [Clostridia bacterium]|nr:hypothetical protein [Clostridia bacterium]